VDTGPEGEEELAAFYEKVLEGDPAPFGLDAGRAAGLEAFEEAMARARPPQLRFVKGHITGPVTLASSLHDLAGRELLYDDTYREVVGAYLAQAIRWQARRLAVFGVPVVLFLDEPAMEVFGSAYSSALTPELVLSLWRPCLDAAREEGAISGIHCCGNTDWGFLFEAGPDIVNFDAFEFLDRMLLYPEAAGRYLRAGGTLAWGLVPTSEAAWGLTADTLLARLEEGMERFAAAGLDPDLLRRQCLLTPSCGMGSLAPELAERILALLVEVSRRVRL
jgi:methionine synthase II (cobalamin-independent)